MPKRATTEQRMAWHAEHVKYCGCRPIPAKLKELMDSERPVASAPSEMRALLSGGDRRSLAQSNRVRRVVESKPGLVKQLAELTADEDWLVGLRALDLMEKLAHEHPEWIEPHKKTFIGPLASSEKWEIRLQIVRALPLLQWSPAEMRRVEKTLIENLTFPRTFVHAWALDSLAMIAERRKMLAPIVQRYLGEFERSPSKALQARARNIRARVAAARPHGRASAGPSSR